MEPNYVLALHDFRAFMIDQELVQADRLARYWLNVENDLSPLVYEFAYAIDSRETGLSQQALLTIPAYLRLIRNIETRLAEFMSDDVVPDVTAEQKIYMAAALQAARAAMDLQATIMPNQYDNLKWDDLDEVAGFSGNGDPIEILLYAALPLAIDRLTKESIRLSNAELGPEAIANELKLSMSIALEAAFLIIRTEQIRAAKEAMFQQYIASGFVVGYRRLAYKDRNTCMACIMADGKFLRFPEDLEEHPRGRCLAVPVLSNAPYPTFQTGHEWFLEQSESTQREMLGPGKYQAWTAGKFKLENIIKRVPNAEWGASIQPASLRELVT